jgi:hypothetical protein
VIIFSRGSFALLDEDHRGHRGDRLCHRGNAEDRVSRHGRTADRGAACDVHIHYTLAREERHQARHLGALDVDVKDAV